MTLIEMLSSIEDTRKRRGIRHKMPNFLIMCLTAMMSGYTGYREIGRFLKENQWEFKKYLTFCKVPTYGSIRRIFMEIDFDDFAQKLNLKCKTTKNNIISSYKEDYFFDRKIREDRVLDDLDRLFQN